MPALYLLLRFQSIAAGGTRLSKALVNACTVSRDPGLAPRWAQRARKVAQRQPLLPDIQIQLSKFAGDTTVVALRRKAEFTKSALELQHAEVTVEIKQGSERLSHRTLTAKFPSALSTHFLSLSNPQRSPASLTPDPVHSRSYVSQVVQRVSMPM